MTVAPNCWRCGVCMADELRALMRAKKDRKKGDFLILAHNNNFYSPKTINNSVQLFLVSPNFLQNKNQYFSNLIIWCCITTRLCKSGNLCFEILASAAMRYSQRRFARLCRFWIRLYGKLSARIWNSGDGVEIN